MEVQNQFQLKRKATIKKYALSFVVWFLPIVFFADWGLSNYSTTTLRYIYHVCVCLRVCVCVGGGSNRFMTTKLGALKGKTRRLLSEEQYPC